MMDFKKLKMGDFQKIVSQFNNMEGLIKALRGKVKRQDQKIEMLENELNKKILGDLEDNDGRFAEKLVNRLRK